MYNLLVSGIEGTWDGTAFTLEASRCINEHTDKAISARFASFDAAAVAELKRLPCIFAYEKSTKAEPLFGRLTGLTKRQGQVRIEYELEPVTAFVTAALLANNRFELDIGEWELNRTHWAVKNVDLSKELGALGVTLPAWAGGASRTVDLATHHFAVGLSFPGEARPLVKEVAAELQRRLGPDMCFYDNNYVAQLARPSLDDFLQDIYRLRSKLIVVFLSGDYERKPWCGVEFRGIKEIIMARDHDRIMFVKTDDGQVRGVFKTDGYVDARHFTPVQIVGFIEERLRLLV